MPAQSSIWSSLYTLESIGRLASTTSSPSRSYLLKAGVDTPILKRHQVLANAIALIGASAPNSDTVTACSVEIVPLGSGEQYDLAVTLRIAQNGGLRPNDQQELQTLVDAAVSNVKSHPLQDFSKKTQRDHIINSIAKGVILPLIVKRCQRKLANIVGSSYAAPFKAWYLVEKERGFPLDALNPIPHTLPAATYLRHIYASCKGNETRKRSERELYKAVYAAFSFPEKMELYKDEWSKWPVVDEDANSAEEDGGEPVNEAQDDAETLDTGDLRKPQIYRFINKLRRYSAACISVIRELVVLYRSGNEFTISVEGVPIVEKTLARLPFEEGEYSSFAEFIREDPRIKVDIETLNPEKIDAVRNRWTKAYAKSNRLILHAELQLAIFYSLNSELNPMHGFIGVSKRCCFCCDFVLKHLQDPNYPESAGPPINFVVEGTHGRRYPPWLFPDPSKQIISTNKNKTSDNHTLAHAEVIQRYMTVRKELETELASQVKVLLNKIEKNDDSASDSSGISLDSNFDSSIWDEDNEKLAEWEDSVTNTVL